MEDGREADSERSPASDLYYTDTHGMQQGSHPSATTAELANGASSQPLTHNHDSDSDAMDVSDDESEPEPAKPLPSPKPQPQPESGAQPNGTLTTGAKRKMGDAITNDHSPSADEQSKKPRLSEPSSQAASSVGKGVASLPVELWQHVFTYLSPAILARQLRVCKDFNAFLTGTKATPGANVGPNGKKRKDLKIHVMDSNEIWAAARKTWFPNLPRPLARCAELQMLQLVGGCSCQSCGRKPESSIPTSYVFHAGPGPEGVRVIWPFGIRFCGPCLELNIEKDVQILVSTASKLRGGLPYILITLDMNYIPEGQRQQPGGIPNNLGANKVYYKKDIANILHEWSKAQEYGSAAAEEWRKGLFDKGKKAMQDASRWEKFEAQVGYGNALARTLREYDPASYPGYLADAQRKYIKQESPDTTGNGTAIAHALPPHRAPQMVKPAQPPQDMPSSSYGGPQPAVMPASSQHMPSPSAHTQRPAKPPQDLEERRQARRQEVERRCMQLSPPLDAHVLSFVESFQAAMQIPQAMTDAAWEMLKPRILAQREVAEVAAHEQSVRDHEQAERDHEHAERLAALRATYPSTCDDSFLKPAKEVYGKGYEAAQMPLRSRLEEYVAEYINSAHHGYPRLDRDSSPVFAAHALLHVFTRYKEDKAAGLLPTVDDIHKEGEQDPFLSLVNMKWIFDNKIRPHTDPHDTQLFICAGCVEEDPPGTEPKWKAFEGLIQHYGARHTSDFSKGNIVVHWQTSEWPEDPPFHPKPENWLKPVNRGTHGNVSRGNGRNNWRNPQARRNGAAQPAQGDGLLRYLDNMNAPQQWANDQVGGAQGYHSRAYGQSNHQAAQYGQRGGHAQPSQQPPPEETEMLEPRKLDQLSADARRVWDALECMSDKELLTCIRVKTVMHNANARFLNLFGSVPTLDHFTEALSSNPDMQPIKVAKGLACKTCVAAQTDGSAGYQSYFARIRNVKLFNASSLIAHFNIVHAPHMPHAIWMKDMLEVPETQLVSDLVRAPGMNEFTLALIAEAFPAAFPTPLPPLETLVREAALKDGAPGTGSGIASKVFERLNKKQKQGQGKKKGGRRGSSDAPGSRESSALPQPREDEYDPRKPMKMEVDEDDDDDAWKFDSDIARERMKKREAAAMASRNGSDATAAFNLAPETLLALQSLKLPQTQTPVNVQGNKGRMERAPSVGRDDVGRSVPPPPQSSSGGIAGQPDIAAILAALTTGMQTQPQPQQVATPTGRGSRDGTVSRGDEQHLQQHRAPSHQPTPYAQHQQHAQPVRYRQYSEAAPPTPAPAPRYEAPGSDLQAALERNARHYAQNQQQQRLTPTPRAYAAEAAYHVSPPRRPQYVYEDGQPAPVQYVQQQYPQPPAYHQVQGYQQPRKVYVDEHGREMYLTPIEAGPAVQYAPAAQQYAPAPQQQGYAQQGYAQEGGRVWYEQPHQAAPPPPPPPQQQGGWYGGR